MSLSSLDHDLGLLLMRITVGALMLFHGIAKIMHPGSLDFISNMLTGNSLPSVLAYGVFIGELVGPIMVIAGYRARLGAMLIMVNMLFALFLVHRDDLFSLTSHGGWMIELQMFYLMGSIAIVFTGSGKYAFRPD